MKVSLYFFAVILGFFLFVNSTFGQSLQILSCDTLVTGTVDDLLNSSSVCKNISMTEQNVKIKIHIITLPMGQEYSVCDLFNCNPPTSHDTTTPVAFTLKPDETTGGFIHLDLSPNNVEGIAKLSLRFFVDNNETDFAEYTATFIVGTAGVTDNTAQMNSLSIYPNPANDFLNITLPKNVSINQGSVEIYNNMGLLVKSNNNKSLPDNLYINTKDLNNGSYLLVVKSGSNKTLSQPFIIYR